MTRKRTLRDGVYLAKCRQKTALSAGMNGHLSVWPEARMEVKGDEAFFSRNSKVVWSCSMSYAAHHFDVTPIEAGRQ